MASRGTEWWQDGGGEIFKWRNVTYTRTTLRARSVLRIKIKVGYGSVSNRHIGLCLGRGSDLHLEANGNLSLSLSGNSSTAPGAQIVLGRFGYHSQSINTGTVSFLFVCITRMHGGQNSFLCGFLLILFVKKTFAVTWE